MPKVLVTGFFDQLNVGHVRFLERAAAWGELHVVVGTDANFGRLKGALPLMNQEERLALVNSLKPVKSAVLSSGQGELDFLADLEAIAPDVFVVAGESHHPDKQAQCERRGIRYQILGRSFENTGSADALVRFPPTSAQALFISCCEPPKGLMSDSLGARLPPLADPVAKPADSLRLPFRICLAGGWLDQPWVSGICPGGVVVVNLVPSTGFVDRAGMATSTRKTARRIWGDRLPSGDPETVAKILFGAENPPGTRYVAGSQDSIGLAFPGANYLYYRGGYWPESIESDRNAETARWLESVIQLIPLGNRPAGYDPLLERQLERAFIEQLAQAGADCWAAIRRRDARLLGRSLSATVGAWEKMLPHTVPAWVKPCLAQYDGAWGRTLSGCGGGYLIVVSEERLAGSVRIQVRI